MKFRRRKPRIASIDAGGHVHVLSKREVARAVAQGRITPDEAIASFVEAHDA